MEPIVISSIPHHHIHTDQLPSSSTSQLTPHDSDNNSNNRRPVSPLTHFIVLTSVLAPIALIPYLAVRRHLLSLHRKIAQVGVTNAALQRDLKTALLESSIRREEHDRLRALVEETKQDVMKSRMMMQQRDEARSESQEKLRRDLKDLLSEKQYLRSQLTSLRELGASLADVAAFMHEVEVQQGLVPRKGDGRGIEKIRQLALKLQNSQPPSSGSGR